MKRLTFRILLCLLLGAVTTVGVAWALACVGLIPLALFGLHMPGFEWSVDPPFNRIILSSGFPAPALEAVIEENSKQGIVRNGTRAVRKMRV